LREGRHSTETQHYVNNNNVITGRSRVLADRTNGRAYATVLRPAVVCDVCIMAKRCLMEQNVLLAAHMKSYMRKRLVPKRLTFTF